MLNSPHQDGKRSETNNFHSFKQRMERHVESLSRTNTFVDEVTILSLYVFVSSLLLEAAYSYHGPVVLRHLTVPGWRSALNKDTRSLPNTTNHLHQQTSFESNDSSRFSMIDPDTRLAYVNILGTRFLQYSQSFIAYHARFHHIPADDNSTVIRTKLMTRRGLPAQRARNRVMTRTHSARSKVRAAHSKDISSKRKTDDLGWPHLDHYRNVVRRFQHVRGPNSFSQSSSFILTNVSPERLPFITGSTRFFPLTGPSRPCRDVFDCGR